ncbi:ribonuclease HII [Blochmannia endosymbiont of Camponotus (Colobopsis) obliquus]|uniref:ribonuclease HII n=1 Tax=Blochmannia endosymbiont of Camponotus (Colobopsis) obliquus TaxID=1505597 RepID=UPI00061A7BE3|nr:ribonuclease HII [Blochmannia endosymbiont of Camponotus (Colobopsis) obliquus]AKC60451.1 ribonuclease HII [Blochmannia endosymbiont of Camponotus (Colobopsis) obliquus]
MYFFGSMSNKLIAGVDEVGRGSLVGAVVAAAVILDPKKLIFGLKDSKRLNEKTRLSLYKNIIKYSISWGMGRAEKEEVDDLNVFQATMLAMQRAVMNLSVLPDYVLVDGNRSPLFPMPSRAIIKGDNKIMSISAASILAKVNRDKEMIALDLQFPEYGFSKNKGYPTVFHLTKLALHGPTIHHRYSFSSVKRYCN